MCYYYCKKISHLFEMRHGYSNLTTSMTFDKYNIHVNGVHVHVHCTYMSHAIIMIIKYLDEVQERKVISHTCIYEIITLNITVL